jgi:hypothetical protein
MKILIYLCIIVAAIVLVIGAVLSFSHWTLIKPGLTYWRGGIAILLFGISLMLLQISGVHKKK